MLSPTSSSTSTATTGFSNAHAPRYDLSINPPYQINHRAKRCGRTITATKRRITFQFGFSSADAIRLGRIAADCRGEEHEVVLVWSHITGKRQLYMDGREFHSSKAARGNTRFEHSWNVPGNHTLKVVANATPPITAEGARQYRQFDLQLDGMSYFDFSRIYELGGEVGGDGGSGGDASANADADGGRGGGSRSLAYSYRGAAYDDEDDARDDDDVEEDEAHRAASRHFLAPQTIAPAPVDLFDVIYPSSSSSPIPSLLCVTTSGDSFLDLHQYHDEFAPKATARSSFDSILGAYEHFAAPSSTNKAPSSCRALVPLSEEGMDPVSRSFDALVNLDDIRHTPDLRQASLRASRAATSPSAPGSWGGQVGRAPTLAEMRLSQSTSPTMSARPVMKASAYQIAQQQHAGNHDCQHPRSQPTSSYDGYGNGQIRHDGYGHWGNYR
jgi:hypothetical protein